MYNPKYKRNNKNGGVIPAVQDKRVLWVPIGCGNCIECRKQKARGWQIRLLEDIKKHRNGKFVTLTFSDESLKELIEKIEKDRRKQFSKEANEVITEYKNLDGYERDNAIATEAVKLFRERWRKEFGKSVRHWLITELGHNGTENVHLHGIIWTDQPISKIREKWQYGYIWPREDNEESNYVSERTVNYIIKYVTKQDEKYKGYKAIILTSPGIGANYTEGYDSKNNKWNGEKTVEAYRTSTGHKIAMPNYWRNKIYTEVEREKLWIQKLDKETRYVCGEKVSIKDGDEAYWKLVEWHRRRSRELGYMTEAGIWKRREYERQRRNIMTEERIKKDNNKKE